MSSKLKGRLKRLHGSRVRATNGEGPAGVYEADDDIEEEVESAPVRAASAAIPAAAPPVEETAVTEQLRRHRELSGKSSKRKKSRPQAASQRWEPSRSPATSAPSPPAAANAAGDACPGIGERLGVLRVQAKALIAANLTESALPLLHEMASISPTNPFPLAELARYYRATGRHELAELYQARLDATAPY